MATNAKHKRTGAKHNGRNAEIARLRREQAHDAERDFSTAGQPFDESRGVPDAPPGRRDHKYVPAGYVDIGTGTLAMRPDPDNTREPMTEADVFAALTVAGNVLAPLVAMYGDPEADGAFDETMDDLARRAVRALPKTLARRGWRKQIRAMYEIQKGHAYGEGWRKWLEDVLDQDAYDRENLRRNPEKFAATERTEAGRELRALWEAGDRRVLCRWRVMTDREVLQRVQTGCEPPPELTVEVVHEMRQMVSLGGGGGRGERVKKSARRIVSDFAEALTNPDKLRAKAKRKRHR